jgi:hypothetical protein
MAEHEQYSMCETDRRERECLTEALQKSINKDLAGIDNTNTKLLNIHNYN